MPIYSELRDFNIFLLINNIFIKNIKIIYTILTCVVGICRNCRVLLDKEIKMVPTKEDTHADTDDTDIDTRIVQVSYCLCILPAVIGGWGGGGGAKSLFCLKIGENYAEITGNQV